MRKIITLFLIATAISCSSDGNGSSSINSDLLIGKWEIQSIKDETGASLSLSPCATGVYSEYMDDSTYKDVYQCGSTQYVDNYTYSVSSNNLTLTFIGDSGEDESVSHFKILALSEELLKTTFNYEDEDGNPHTNTFTYQRLP